MNAVPAKRVWTTEELLALPDDGVERWLIRGELWEQHPDENGDGVTKRNRFHSVIEAEVAGHLWAWVRSQSRPRGRVVCGEAGFILKRNPDTAVGIDVAYVSPAMAAANPPDTMMFDGPPVLAVEILSPNDTQRKVAAKVREYLANGVAAVWVIEPDLQTVMVYKPGAVPVSFGVGQTLTGGPELPGFSAPVADFFL